MAGNFIANASIPKSSARSRLPRCDDEQAREPQQDLAIVAGRIGLGDPGGVVGKESLSRRVVERVEEWSQRRALKPLDNRLRPRHYVIVDDVPDIEMTGE